MEKFLEIKGLKNNNLDILIKKNTISTFSGANNCGKTTFIRILGKQLDCESEIELENKKITDYTLEEYNELVKTVIPKELIFDETNIEEELYNKCSLEYKEKEILINYIIKGLKLKKFITKEISNLTTKEVILAQIAISLLNKPSAKSDVFESTLLVLIGTSVQCSLPIVPSNPPTNTCPGARSAVSCCAKYSLFVCHHPFLGSSFAPFALDVS